MRREAASSQKEFSRGGISRFLTLSLAIHLVALIAIAAFWPSAHVSSDVFHSVELLSASVEEPKGSAPTKKRTMTFDPKTLAAISGVFARNRASILAEAAVEEVRRRVEAENATVVVKSREEQERINRLVAEYYDDVGGTVKSNWKTPLWLASRTSAETVILLRVARDGSLAYATFENSSGNHHFDEAAMRAVRKSAPFAPLPPWISDEFIEIGIKFNPKEIR